MQEAELMYKLFDLVSGNLEEVNAFVAFGSLSFRHRNHKGNSYY